MLLSKFKFEQKGCPNVQTIQLARNQKEARKMINATGIDEKDFELKKVIQTPRPKFNNNLRKWR
jgi:translation initiation factor 1 (eIF-1/SUI1)